MKKINLLALLIASASVANAQNVKFSPAKAEAGKVVKFTYDPKDTKLEKLDEIKCYGFNFFSPNKISSKAIKLTKTNGVYTGEFNTTDSTSLVGLSFSSGDEKDENPNGYLLELHKKGVVQAETYANEAYVYSGFGKYYFGMNTDAKKTVDLYKKSFALKPALKSKVLISYLAAEQKLDKDNGNKLIKESILNNSKIANATEKDLNLSASLYSLLKEKTATDSIRKVIAAKFPKGDLAYGTDLNELSKTKDLAVQEKLAQALVDKFGLKASLKKDENRLNTINRILASSFLKDKNYEKFDFYANKITDKIGLASIYNSLAWPMAEKNENIDFAAEKSKKSLALLESAKADPVPASFDSKEDYLNVISNNYTSYADTYALLLYRKGDFKQALAMQEKVIADKELASNDVKERYVTYLIKNNLNEKAFFTAEQLIRTGGATDSLNNDFKRLFKILDKKGNADEYLAKLNDEAKNAELKALSTKMLNSSSPDFSLQNLKGETVKLSDLKGKIVILDFWATWCGPCKASFPGMQKAINKYANNPNVVFLFVNTWQREADRNKIVADFIKEQKYTFNVLLDTKDKTNPDKFDVVDAFKIDGIPTKFIIGADGNIKFKAVGFVGSDEAVVKEIDNMITLLSSSEAKS